MIRLLKHWGEKANRVCCRKVSISPLEEPFVTASHGIQVDGEMRWRISRNVANLFPERGLFHFKRDMI
jgi:hypothetical protein